jgi:hypothetical protein
MNSNKKSFNYKVLNIVKHCNFGEGCASIRGYIKKLKNLYLKTYEFKINIWDPKKLQIKNLPTTNIYIGRHYNFFINYVNIQGHLGILNFEFF